MTDELAALRERRAEEQAEQRAWTEIWARICRRADALSWWLAAHPRPSITDWIDLQTSGDLERPVLADVSATKLLFPDSGFSNFVCWFVAPFLVSGCNCS